MIGNADVHNTTRNKTYKCDTGVWDISLHIGIHSNNRYIYIYDYMWVSSILLSYVACTIYIIKPRMFMQKKPLFEPNDMSIYNENGFSNKTHCHPNLCQARNSFKVSSLRMISGICTNQSRQAFSQRLPGVDTCSNMHHGSHVAQKINNWHWLTRSW